MKKKRVLIIGATGMLGHMVYSHFESLGTYDLYNTVYRTALNINSILCDVKDQQAVISLLNQIQPNVIVNCVGALVRESKKQPSSAVYLNALFPHLLTDWCDKNTSKLIHISTDCVFSGKKGDYAEDDFRDADDIYGRSKALGEIFHAPHCTLRTSIIGPELKNDGTGLLHWFLNEKNTVSGYNNVFWGGVTTLELSKKIGMVIDKDLVGMYHITNGDKVSKYDLLLLIDEIFGMRKQIIKNSNIKSDKSLKSKDQAIFKVQDHRNMIKELSIFMKQNELLYKHYENSVV